MKPDEAIALEVPADPAGRLDGVVRMAPITQRAARAWVNATHRHLDYPTGDLYRVALLLDGELIAVGVSGRPTAKWLQDGTTAEFLRVSSIGEVALNACSRLYGALRRAGLALGYTRFVTYTLEHEPGTSLRAAGFYDDGLTEGGEWSRPSRARRAAQQAGRKRRWIWPNRSTGAWDNVQPNAPLSRERSESDSSRVMPRR